jgi:hypothetical protein
MSFSLLKPFYFAQGDSQFENSANFFKYNEKMTEIPKYNYQISNSLKWIRFKNSIF